MASALKWLGAILLAALIVAAAGLIGPRLAGTTQTTTELGQVGIRLSPSLAGGMEGYIPVADWGIRFEKPPVPFKVRAELRSLNRDALLRGADGDQSVIDATEAELRDGVRDAVLRNLAWALAVALVLLVLAGLIWRSLRPRWVLPLLGLAIFAGATVTMGLVARASIDRDSFDNPTFFASGGELKRILEVIDETDVESPYGSEFESIVRSISAVLATGGTPEGARKEIYLGSDLHANPLVIRPVSRLVGNQPLLMVGDFGQRGSPAESALIAPRVAALGRRVVAVSGNHDSSVLMRRLASDGVTVLARNGTLQADGSFKPPPVIEVDGIEVAGWADPLEYGGGNPLGNRAVTLDDLENPEATESRWVSQILRWFDSLRHKPDVLMIHQESLAIQLAEALEKSGSNRRQLTIATGHTHEQKLEKIGSTVVVNPGTIGAGGVFDAGRQEIGLTHLRFNADGSLRSAELISVEPFSGAARATRVVIDNLCPDEKRCSAVIPEQVVTG